MTDNIEGGVIIVPPDQGIATGEALIELAKEQVREAREGRETYAVGEQAWFEYHCWESDKSADADLWHRSHQRVTVLAMETNDAPAGSSFVDRMEDATPFTYTIRFEDGHQGSAFEDELMDDRAHFCRPDPKALS